MSTSNDVPCRELVVLITAYRDGVLDRAVLADIDAHLATCVGCVTVLAQ